jgi:hypothetical protein
MGSEILLLHAKEIWSPSWSSDFILPAAGDWFGGVIAVT